MLSATRDGVVNAGGVDASVPLSAAPIPVPPVPPIPAPRSVSWPGGVSGGNVEVGDDAWSNVSTAATTFSVSITLRPSSTTGVVSGFPPAVGGAVCWLGSLGSGGAAPPCNSATALSHRFLSSFFIPKESTSVGSRSECRLGQPPAVDSPGGREERWRWVYTTTHTVLQDLPLARPGPVPIDPGDVCWVVLGRGVLHRRSLGKASDTHTPLQPIFHQGISRRGERGRRRRER